MSGLISIPLAKAVLCQDCETISNSDGKCPACGSETLVPLARWIRPLGPVEERAKVLEGEQYAGF